MAMQKKTHLNKSSSNVSLPLVFYHNCYNMLFANKPYKSEGRCQITLLLLSNERLTFSTLTVAVLIQRWSITFLHFRGGTVEGKPHVVTEIQTWMPQKQGRKGRLFPELIKGLSNP